MSTYLPADIFTRFCRLRGDEAIHICATDDFGTPILVMAEKEGVSPEELVSYWNKRDLEDFTQLGIAFDFFYKTSSKENIELAQYFFKKLYERGYIYKRRISQLYCEKDKKFLPDRYVIGTCPYCRAENQYSDVCEVCGRSLEPGEVLDPRCIICGSTPVKKESEHYFFRLSSFADELQRWLKGNQNLQPDVKKYVLRWIEGGLKDWDITRDMSWGVPIPFEEAKGKVLYGWFENHICYISSTLKYLKEKGIDGKEYWNTSKIYHFIGKDIVYHHYLFLSAMRMGIGEEFKLPDFIPTRGHLLLQGHKFSKSRGWYVGLREFLQSFPADYLRYYLASITPYSQSDVNFDWDEFFAKINNELVANIGNFIYRVLSFIYSRFDSTVPKYQGFDAQDEEFKARIKSIAKIVSDRLEANEIDRALKRIVDFSSYCNQYFQRKEPWKGKDEARTCLYLSVNAVRSLAILLAPYLVYSMEELWRQLNLEGSVHRQPWDSASYLAINPGHKIGEPKPLFKKLERRQIEAQKERLGRS